MRSIQRLTIINPPVVIIALLVLQAAPGHAQPGFYKDGVIPPRDPQTSPSLVDLSDFYTAPLDNDWLVSAGVNLHNLPKGIQTFAGVHFDVRGIVQLASTELLRQSTLTEAEKAKQYPQKVEGIPVKLKADKIHFLQASAWGADNNQKVGEYIVHYSDGTQQSIPLLYNQTLIDWWVKTATTKPTDVEIAWNGTHIKSMVNLFKYTWTNPTPEKTIDNIDFVSAMAMCAPFLIALTCEPIATKTIKTGLRIGDSRKKELSDQAFDLRGRIIRSFSGTEFCQAETGVSSGLYFTHIVSGEGNGTTKLSLMH
jgi:hypothetical protein